MKKTVSIILCLISAALVLFGCEKEDRFTDEDPVAPYDSEETIEPTGGGKFILREKRYTFNGHPVTVFSMENVCDEPYEVTVTVRFRNTEGKALFAESVSLAAIGPGMRNYCLFEPENDYASRVVNVVSRPAENNEYLDIVKFDNDYEVYAAASYRVQDSHNPAYSDPVFNYHLTFHCRVNYDVNYDKTLIIRGKAVVLDNNGDIIEVFNMFNDIHRGKNLLDLTKTRPDIPWDDNRILPESIRDNVTGFISVEQFEVYENP